MVHKQVLWRGSNKACFLSSLLFSSLFVFASVFASDNSASMQMPYTVPHVVESESTLSSYWTIENRRDRWIVTSSELSDPMEFSHHEMMQIIASMPADSKALWLGGDWRPVMVHMTEHNIRPQTSAATLESTIAPERSGAARDHTLAYQPIMARMRELSSMGSSRRIIRTNIHLQTTMHSYLRLQAQGKKKELLAIREKLQAELDRAFAPFKCTIWSGWAKSVQQRIRALDIVLAQDITEQLHRIRTLPSHEGEHIAAQLQTRHFSDAGFDVALQSRRVLATRRAEERFKGSLFSADVAEMKEVQEQLRVGLAHAKTNAERNELQRRIDRVQSWIDDPDLSLLADLKKASSIEEAYSIRRRMESKPIARDIDEAMRHIWCQKEGYREFASLPESEREARIAQYQAQSITRTDRSSTQSQLASNFLEREFGIAKDRYLNCAGSETQQRNHRYIRRAIDSQVGLLKDAQTIEEQGLWAVALQASVDAFKRNEAGNLADAPLQAYTIDQSELLEFATHIVSRLGENAQHPLSFIREKIENVIDFGYAIADLTICQVFRTPEQQVERIQAFIETIDSFTGLPWPEKKRICANAIADSIAVTGFARAAILVKNLATAIPSYLPAITTAFTEGSSDLFERLSENLFGATFHGGAGSAQVIASQEVIAESIAQVASGFAVAAAADGSAALSLPDPFSILRQDNQKETGGGAPDAVKSQPTKTVDDLIDEAVPGRPTHGPTRQYELKGDYEKAVRDFKSLNPQRVKDISLLKDGSKLIGELEDGTVVMVRNVSSRGQDYPSGCSTLEVKLSKRNILKIRYI